MNEPTKYYKTNHHTIIRSDTLSHWYMDARVAKAEREARPKRKLTRTERRRKMNKQRKKAAGTVKIGPRREVAPG